MSLVGLGLEEPLENAKASDVFGAAWLTSRCQGETFPSMGRMASLTVAKHQGLQLLSYNIDSLTP